MYLNNYIFILLYKTLIKYPTVICHGVWQGIRSIRSQGRLAPSFYRTTRSHYKPHELCKTSDYSIYMYYYHMYHLYYSSCTVPKYNFANTLHAIFP